MNENNSINSNIPTNAREFSQSVSLASELDLIRNLIHRIAQDNSVSLGLLELVSNINLNTSPFGNKSKVIVETITDDTKTKLISLKNFERIIVYGIYVSANGASTISFLDENDNDLFAKFYASAAGDFYSREIKTILDEGQEFYIKASSSITYSVDIIYSIFEEK